MILKTLIFMSSLSLCVFKCDFNTQFVVDYYRKNNVKQLVWFACWNDADKITNIKKLHTYQISASYFDTVTNVPMAQILKYSLLKTGVFLDFDCSQSERVFEKFSASGFLYNETYHWLVLTKNINLLIDTAKHLPLGVNTEFTTAHQINNDFVLYDVYNPSYKHGQILNVTYMGHWNPLDGLNITLNDFKYVRRANLNGMELKFGAVANHKPSNLSLEEYLLRPVMIDKDTMTRYSYNLLLQLKDMYNFTMRLVRRSTWGYKINGSFNGIVGDMAKGIIDVSVSPMMMRQERLDVIDYTVQSFIIRGAIFLRHPKKKSIRNVFLMPLAAYAWYAILVIGIFYWLILCAIILLERMNSEDIKNVFYERPFFEAAFATLVALTQQGLNEIPRFYSGRVLCLSLFIWSLLLFQFYSASVVGSLLAQPPRFINTLPDLTKSNFEVGIQNISYMHNFFRMVTYPTLVEFKNVKLTPTKKRKHDPFMNSTEGFRRVKVGGFAYYCDVNIGYKLIRETFTENEICDLVEIELFSPRDIGTSLQKFSPFRKMFTYGFRKMLDAATTKRLYKIWQERKNECPESFTSSPLPIQLQDFSPLMFLLTIGVIISGIICIVEIILSKTSVK